MSDERASTPHFLRVTRALAGVRDAALPIAAITTVVIGTYAGCANGTVVARGIQVMPEGGGGGDGGASTASSSSAAGGYGGYEVGSSPMDAGHGGGVVLGLAVMPDAGADSG